MASTDEQRQVKNDLAIKSLRRRAWLEAANDYLSFGIGKAAGLGLSFVGFHDMFSHEAIMSVVHNPSLVAGSGMALVGGAKIAKVVRVIIDGMTS